MRRRHIMIGNDNEATLNSLIATTLDSADGYRKAAEKADNERYRSMFLDFASQRETCVRDLQAEVRALGGNPEDDGTVLASAHRAFLSLRDAVTGTDDTAIVNEVERGEDHIKAKYEAALKDGNLTGSAQAAVQKAYQSVREGHDRMSQLKHSLQGEHAATSGDTSYDRSGTNGGIAAGTGTGAAFGSTTAHGGTGSGIGFDEPQSGYGAAPGTATSGGAMTGGNS
jgi:uncharacterized protein (TIGR02284 family)